MHKVKANINHNLSLEGNGLKLKSNAPVVMGIINLSPDSFYTKSRESAGAALIAKAEQMISEGASLLDLGAASSRPGAPLISEEEELRRLLPALRLLRATFPEVFISVDTFRAEVALAASESGANMINDISAGNLDKKMFKAVAETKLPYVLMHMPGKPENMMKLAHYENVVKEVFHFLSKKLESAMDLGIHQVIIDPGFGFGKNTEHNLKLLNKLKKFAKLQKPIMVGLSRKATIYTTLETDAEHALNGTTVLNTIALLNGAAILRVHDVKEAVEAITLTQAYQTANSKK